MTYARYNGLAGASGGGGGSGTVTSVGLSDASTSPIFNVTGSPVTTSGTLTLTLKTVAANLVFAGPGTGVAAQPTFRALVAADIPSLPYVTSVGLSDASTSPIFNVSGSPVTGSGTLSLTLQTQSANLVFAGPGTGTAAQPTFRTLVAADIPSLSYVTSVSIASANGFAGSSSGGTTPSLTLSTSVTGILQGNGTAISAASTTGSGNVVLATAPTMSNPVVGTQSQLDGSTKAASTSYVDIAVANAVAGLNPAVAVQAATTTASDTSGFTYNNGVSGIGATFIGTINSAVTIDGYTFTATGQRLLVKNDTQSPSGAFNGVYFLTQLQTSLLAPIFTRATDYDTPSDINNTGAIPVINGTANGTTSWVQTAQIVTVGTTSLVFVEFTKNPANYLLAANNLSDVTTRATAFNNISPMTTAGDMIYGGSSGVGTRLPIGSSSTVLTVSGGIPSWQPAGINNSAVTSSTLTIFYRFN